MTDPTSGPQRGPHRDPQRDRLRDGLGDGPRLPNFLYIGPDKAGSSWLHEVLLQHPDVFLTEAKDLYFFDRYYDRGLAWYRNHFRRAGAQHKVVGEVCQDYLFHPGAPKRILQDLGTIALMVTLREPAARAYSSYLYMLKHAEDVGTFREALSSRPELLEHSRYGSAIARFLEYFPREALYVADFDRLREDPQAFVDDLTSWLEIRHLVLDEDQLGARLPASEARLPILARAVRGLANWTREHDGAALVGRVKRSRRVQRMLYRPLGPDVQTISAADQELVWDLLGDDMDQVKRLTGVDVRAAWVTGRRG